MALFINKLVEMNKDKYMYEDLIIAEKGVNRQYPDTIKLWLF